MKREKEKKKRRKGNWGREGRREGGKDMLIMGHTVC